MLNLERVNCLINCDNEFDLRESGKIEALKTMHSKKLETMIVEKVLYCECILGRKHKTNHESKGVCICEKDFSIYMNFNCVFLSFVRCILKITSSIDL